jgi:hypothetical protein|tara:strand:+ start:269 stop:709 length:441 start_codon:yes stop_codon:yes gene_type:complete
MAYVIYRTDITGSSCVRFVKDDTDLALRPADSNEVAITVTDSVFQDLITDVKDTSTYSGTTATINDVDAVSLSEEDFKDQKEKIENRLMSFKNAFDNDLATRANTYLTALGNVDVSSITFPLAKTVNKYMKDENSDLEIIHPWMLY